MKSCLFSVLDVPWMVFNDLTPQHIPVDMGINFGCCDGLVSQHTLYGTQVRASFQQVGSEGIDRKSTRLNSSHIEESRMPSSA